MNKTLNLQYMRGTELTTAFVQVMGLAVPYLAYSLHHNNTGISHVQDLLSQDYTDLLLFNKLKYPVL